MKVFSQRDMQKYEKIRTLSKIRRRLKKEDSESGNGKDIIKKFPAKCIRILSPGIFQFQTKTVSIIHRSGFPDTFNFAALFTYSA